MWQWKTSHLRIMYISITNSLSKAMLRSLSFRTGFFKAYKLELFSNATLVAYQTKCKIYLVRGYYNFRYKLYCSPYLLACLSNRELLVLFFSFYYFLNFLEMMAMMTVEWRYIYEWRLHLLVTYCGFPNEDKKKIALTFWLNHYFGNTIDQ